MSGFDISLGIQRFRDNASASAAVSLVWRVIAPPGSRGAGRAPHVGIAPRLLLPWLQLRLEGTASALLSRPVCLLSSGAAGAWQ